MKTMVQQQAVYAVFCEVMAPEYTQLPADEDGFTSVGEQIRLNDAQILAKLARAIRLSAVAFAEIESAFPAG